MSMCKHCSTAAKGPRSQPVSLLAPPKFSQLVFSSSAAFLTGTSCCEITHARGYYCAWPGWAVSVDGSLALGDLGSSSDTAMNLLCDL